VYRGLKVIAMAPVLDEEQKIALVVRRTPRDIVDGMLVIDDGSTDRSAEVARREGARVISMGRVAGVGAALRAGYAEALAGGYDVAVVMAGNNKDSPEEITRLLDPIAEGRADFVQGSRFLSKGADFGAMPLYRKVATRVHPLLFSLVTGRWVTESTNGYRAVHRRILEDPRLDLDQAWLDGYELEPYLYIRSIQLGYRTLEAPVSKVYPPKSVGQTKMKPISGWWSMLKPLVLMGLRLKK
jgi:glycosyltransferase involved in cell wall biosynthesis